MGALHSPEAEAVAREYMLYRLVHSGWGLFRILDEEGIDHGDVLTERDVVSLLAGHWAKNLKADDPVAVVCGSSTVAAVAVSHQPKAIRRFRMFDRHPLNSMSGAAARNVVGYRPAIAQQGEGAR